jgi:amino acid transporter
VTTSAPARRRPPITVTVAAVLLLASLVVLFVMLAASVWSDTQNAKMYANSPGYGPADVQSTHVTEALELVFLLAVGFGLVAMAFFTLRGRRGARIAAFIFCGLVAALMFYGMVRSAAGLNKGNAGVATGAASDAVFGFVSFLFLVYVAVIVLLALPPSNRFFRPPPTPSYRPPAPYPYQGQPGYQAQPSYQGQPAYQDQYGHQGQPPQQGGWGQPPYQS